MNNCYRLLMSALVGSCLLVLAILPLAAQDKPGNPAYDWLNGKWSGPAPLGGELQLELRVVDDDKVVGQSKIPIAGSKRSPAGTVSGTVKGDQVNVEIVYPTSTQNWRFRLKDQNLTATRKGEEVIFKKIE